MVAPLILTSIRRGVRRTSQLWDQPSLFVLCHSNIISAISWRWDKEKDSEHFYRLKGSLTSICIVWEELAFDDTVSYAQWWKRKLAEVMAWGIEPLIFRKKSDTNYSATEGATTGVRRVIYAALIRLSLGASSWHRRAPPNWVRSPAPPPLFIHRLLFFWSKRKMFWHFSFCFSLYVYAHTK